MKKNIGKTDKIIRIVLAIVLAYLDWSGIVTGAFSWVLSVIAILLLVTAFINFCPAYLPLGINTCKTKE